MATVNLPDIYEKIGGMSADIKAINRHMAEISERLRPAEQLMGLVESHNQEINALRLKVDGLNETSWKTKIAVIVLSMAGGAAGGVGSVQALTSILF